MKTNQIETKKIKRKKMKTTRIHFEYATTHEIITMMINLVSYNSKNFFDELLIEF